MRILALNAGSSSQKGCLYHLGEPLPQSPSQPVWEARMEWAPSFQNARLGVKTSAGEAVNEPLDFSSRSAAGLVRTDHCSRSAIAVCCGEARSIVRRESL